MKPFYLDEDEAALSLGRALRHTSREDTRDLGRRIWALAARIKRRRIRDWHRFERAFAAEVGYADLGGEGGA